LFSASDKPATAQFWPSSRGRLFRLNLVVATVLSLGCIGDVSAEVPPGKNGDGTYEIHFQGNATKSAGKLRREAARELEAFEKQGQRPADIDDAAFQILIAYRKDGHAFAEVDYRIEKRTTHATVTFLITEGPRVLIRDISFSGNSTFDDDKLRAYFKKDRFGLLGKDELPFVRSQVETAVDEIRQVYLSEGYLDVRVAAPQFVFSEDRSRVNVDISIHEGLQYILREIDIREQNVAAAQNDLERLRREFIGKPYYNRKKLLIQAQLIEIFGNLGYPDADVEINRKAEAEPGQVVLEVLIRSGPLVTISEVAIRGDTRTRPGFIRNRIRLKPGDRYNLALQKDSFRDLYKTGIFSKVDFDLENKDDPAKRVLVVSVEEKPSKELFFEPGWGSYERLRLRMGFREKNLFGTGRIFGTQATGSLKAQSLAGNLADPFFLNTDVRADLTAFYNHRIEPSYTRNDIGLSFALTKSLAQDLTATAEYMLRKTDISDLDVADEATNPDNNYGYASIRLQASYDTRNDLFFPTTGQRLHASVEQADQGLGSGINLTRLVGGARAFFHLARYTVLGLRYTSGILIPGRNEITLPIAERFFNGGENTVRSFKEQELGPTDLFDNPVGGYGFNVFNIELRQRLVGNLVGTLFFDYGNVAPNSTREKQGKEPYDSRSDVISDTVDDFFKDFRPGIGFGFQYLLPVGPARVDFAFNPDHDPDRDENSFVFHFSVGTAF